MRCADQPEKNRRGRPTRSSEAALLLPGIVDFFEEGAATGKGVLELIGDDVAAFCDGLIKDSRTYADVYQESLSREPGPAGM